MEDDAAAGRARVFFQGAPLVALEFAVVLGPTWVQAEWFGNVTESTQDGDLEFGGGYVEAGWFLTGEHRLYVTEEAAFGRLTPTRLFRGGNPFRKGSKGGALEFVGRASTTDLNDAERVNEFETLPVRI